MIHDLPHGSPQASGVTEFLSHSTSSQPTPVSRLFSPSTVQDSLVKGEQVPLHGGSPQVPATGSSKYFPEWGALGFMEEISSLLLMGRPFTGSIIKPGLQNLQSAQAGEMLTGHQSSIAIAAEQAQGAAVVSQQGQLAHSGNHAQKAWLRAASPIQKGTEDSCQQSGKLEPGTAVAMNQQQARHRTTSPGF